MYGPPSSPPVSRGPTSAGLLPAFAPQSSSPQPGRELLRPKFAIYRDPTPQPTFLPTPIPTSEANAPASSSPPGSPVQQAYQSSPLAHAKPLAALIVVRVPLSGAPVTLGRSSKSSTFALRARNKLASRVHARLSVSQNNFVVIQCLGWNGLIVSVPQEPGLKQDYEVARGETLNVERMDGITIDVHGDKSLIEFDNDAEETEEELWRNSEQREVVAQEKQQSAAISDSDTRKRASEASENEDFAERNSKRRKTDDDATHPPRALSIADFASWHKSDSATSCTLQASPAAPEVLSSGATNHTLGAPLEVPATTKLEVPESTLPTKANVQEHSRSSVHGAVPGALTTKEATPEPTAQPMSQHLRSASQTPSAPTDRRKKHQELSEEVRRELKNVVVNFIAFSRLSAVPIATVRKASTQLQSLPKSQVRELIRGIECIGVTEAQRDDAGRLPDDEYYYTPELDEDESRRTIVQSTRGHRSLRSCRKTRKQYFYRPLNLTE